MMAYRIIQELAVRWAHLGVTVKEGIDELSTFTAALCICQKVIRSWARSDAGSTAE